MDHVVLKGSTEEWELKNDVLAGNWTHPVHIHFEEGRVTERTVRVDVGLPTERTVVQTLLPDEDANNARRDVYPLPGQNSVKLKMQFRDFVGRYLIHCHNMGHEDNFMMVRWDIVATKSEMIRAWQRYSHGARRLGCRTWLADRGGRNPMNRRDLLTRFAGQGAAVQGLNSSNRADLYSIGVLSPMKTNRSSFTMT